MRNILIPKDEAGTSTPKEIYGWRIYFLAFSASWASAMFGYDSAFIGGTLTLPSFKRAYGLDSLSTTELSTLSSNIVATFQAGAFFGCMAGFAIAETIGRKKAILIAGLVFVVGVILQMIGVLGALYAGRVFTGLAIGGSSMLIPIYISECAPAAIRGRLVGTFEIMLSTALVFGFWINYGVEKNIPPDTDKQWHIPVAVQFIPAGLLLLSMPFQIESPRWLAAKNRNEAALKALSKVRNLPPDHEYIVNEMSDIERSINYEVEQSGGNRSVKQIFREITEKGVRNRVLVGVALMWLQNLQG